MLEKLAAALLRRDNFGDLRHALDEVSFGHGISQRAGRTVNEPLTITPGRLVRPCTNASGVSYTPEVSPIRMLQRTRSKGYRLKLVVQQKPIKSTTNSIELTAAMLATAGVKPYTKILEGAGVDQVGSNISG